MSVLAHPISDHHADPDIYPIRIAELPDGTTLNGVYLVYRRTQVELVPLVRLGFLSGSADEWVVRPLGSSAVEVIIGELVARDRARDLAEVEWARLTGAAR